MSQNWTSYLQEAEKTCVVQDGKRKVHYKFNDGREMVEEYNLDTNCINKRAWKVCKSFGSQPTWEIEVGDPEFLHAQTDLENIGISEISTAPVMSKRITKTSLEWRIRNLPYPLETYKVTADVDKCAIIVKTTNKKYFKSIPVIDLQRINKQIQQENISISHKFNTLIISYKKPPELILSEKLLLEEINQGQTLREGDVQCPQS